MTPEQLTGKYTRLRCELAAAYAEPEVNLGRTGRIDRIAEEMADIERALTGSRAQVESPKIPELH